MSVVGVTWRVVALTLILFGCFAVAGGVVGLANSGSAETAAASTVTLLLVCLLEVAVMSFIILRSRWHGWQLMAALFVVFYGVTTFMSQIESAVFITRLPPGVLQRLFAFGALVALPFSVLSVVILGKRKPDASLSPNRRLIMHAGEWAWKIATLIVAYLLLYFTFGYFIAWRNPAVLEYYGGTDPGSLLAQMQTVLRDTPWLVPFQILRAVLWVLLALPVIRMLKGPTWKTALSVGLLFAVVMNAQLLLPNPYMPEAVRMAHLVETTTSNFIFGALVGWLLTEHHEHRKVAIA